MTSPPSKDEIRERVWSLLDERGVSRFPRPARGRIPNFEGSNTASMRILGMPEFRGAEVVKVNPDYPQVGIRRGALRAGKLLVMPPPRLRNGFLMLDPGEIHERDRARAATIRGSFSFGVQTALEDIPPIDLVVCGSVAVTEGGARVGKGGGYSEIEYAVLASLGKVDGGTPIVTSVHELQIVPEVPMEEHDFTVDHVATPARLMRTTGPRQRPFGIIWERLSEEKLASIPLLREMRNSQDVTKSY